MHDHQMSDCRLNTTRRSLYKTVVFSCPSYLRYSLVHSSSGDTGTGYIRLRPYCSRICVVIVANQRYNPSADLGKPYWRIGALIYRQQPLSLDYLTCGSLQMRLER